jgi:hypothetical protein
MSWGCRELSGVLRRRSLECGRWRSLECELCVCDARNDATWHESSLIHSKSPAVLSGVKEVILAVAGRGVTSQILSATWEAESKTALSLAGQYGLHVRRESAGPDGAKKIVWDVWC